MYISISIKDLWCVVFCIVMDPRQTWGHGYIGEGKCTPSSLRNSNFFKTLFSHLWEKTVQGGPFGTSCSMNLRKMASPIFIGSMYAIFTYIYHKNQLNVGKYTIHGWYGILKRILTIWTTCWSSDRTWTTEVIRARMRSSTCGENLPFFS